MHDAPVQMKNGYENMVRQGGRTLRGGQLHRYLPECSALASIPFLLAKASMAGRCRLALSLSAPELIAEEITGVICCLDHNC